MMKEIVIKIGDKNFKECDVIMLPALIEDSNLLLCIKTYQDIKECDDDWGKKGEILDENKEGNLRIGLTISCNKEFYKPQHLYVLSNDEIYEGDYFYNKVTKNIVKSSSNVLEQKFYCNKIIATTDLLLKQDGICGINDDFLLEYSEKNGINNILVQYLAEYKTEGDWLRSSNPIGYILKDFPDNLISIRMPIITPKVYNKEEVKTMFYELLKATGKEIKTTMNFRNSRVEFDKESLDKWINNFLK